MNSLNEIKSVVDQELAAVNNECDSFFCSYNGLVHNVFDYSFAARGKQIRPILMLLVSRLFGRVSDEVIRLAAFVETMHTASLFHDDVVDCSTMRRGHKSVNAVWNNRTAILTGDLLIADLITKTTEEFGSEIALQFVKAIQKMSESELKQIEREMVSDINEDSYFEVINGKTATLMSTCCLLAARQSKAPQDVIDSLTEFGRLFGIVFQLRDDILDFEGGDSIGKPHGADLLEGNFTLPAIYYLNQLPESDKNTIIQQIINQENVNLVVENVAHSRAMESTREVMYSYLNQALQILDSLNQYDTVLLRQLLEVVAERNK